MSGKEKMVTNDEAKAEMKWQPELGHWVHRCEGRTKTRSSLQMTERGGESCQEKWKTLQMWWWESRKQSKRRHLMHIW